MTYVKWVILTVGIVFLTACNAENTDVNKEAPVESEQAAPKTSEKETEEKTAVEQSEQPTEEPEKESAKAPAEPEYRLDSATWNLEPIGDSPAQAVLITIDDAPADHSVVMAATLKEYKVPAIFFVNGHFLDSDEEKVNLKKIHDMGFAIGNHTYSHNNLKTIDEEQQREEILSLNETIEQIIGEKPRFFRAPNGSNTDYSKALVAQEGMLLMNWSYGYDWEKQYMDASALTDIMVNTEFLRDGANLLMHDREWTAAALPGIIKGLEAKGYSFIDPDEIESSQ